MEINNVAVIGAGTMGNGIAHCFAQHNFKVNLIDVSNIILNNALLNINLNLNRQLKKNKISIDLKKNTLKRITKHINIENGLQNVDFAIEVVSESLLVKKDIFRKMDAYSPKKAILASNTSSISISELALFTRRESKVIGMHFMNPVPIMGLIEIIKGLKTSDETITNIELLSKKLNKTPLIVKDSPGFISNRILIPMINEAIEALSQGVSGVYEIDQIMKLGMAHPMGPLRLADLIGLDICLSIMKVLHKEFKNDKYKPSQLLIKMVNDSYTGIKAGVGFYDYRISRNNPSISPQFRNKNI